MVLSHRNLSFDLHYELIDWFLYDENINATCVNLIQLSVLFHIETTHLICTNQITGFYMKYKPGLEWVNDKRVIKMLNH